MLLHRAVGTFDALYPREHLPAVQVDHFVRNGDNCLLSFGLSSKGTAIADLGLSTCFIGIFLGWRMVDVGGKRRVELGEDQTSFENKGQEPPEPQKRGVKNFENFEF